MTAEPYYVNFMFNHLRGRQSAKLEQMRKKVIRFHGLLKRHVVRKPDAPRWKDLVPGTDRRTRFPGLET
jgi:hypothetical protein